MVEVVLQRWTDFCAKMNWHADTTTKWWGEILHRYTEPQRQYHTIQHLDELLMHYDSANHLFEDHTAVLLTLFFHDIIYNPKARDNEEQSAKLFRKFAAEARLSQALVDRVSFYIEQTKNHIAVSPSAEKDLLLFLDMDIAILGSKRSRYMDYANQILHEYSHMDVLDFRRGRAAVLENFNKSRPLYKTSFFHAQFEEKSKDNLDWEILALKAPLVNLMQLNLTDLEELYQLELSVFPQGDGMSREALTFGLAMCPELMWGQRDHNKKLISAICGTVVPKSPEHYSTDYRLVQDHTMGNTLMIHTLVVHKSMQNKGCGTTLIRHYLPLAVKHFPKIKTAVCMVPAAAATFFQRQGFTKVGESDEFRQRRAASAEMMLDFTTTDV